MNSPNGYIVGWNDETIRVRWVETLEDAAALFPEVLDGIEVSEKSFAEAVALVNQEGNYNEFVFRRAFEFEDARLNIKKRYPNLTKLQEGR